MREIFSNSITTNVSRPHPSALEREIDQLVYNLHGLTYDEVKIVELGFGMSKEEYEKVDA